jgi:hypothetical protein
LVLQSQEKQVSTPHGRADRKAGERKAPHIRFLIPIGASPFLPEVVSVPDILNFKDDDDHDGRYQDRCGHYRQYRKHFAAPQATMAPQRAKRRFVPTSIQIHGPIHKGRAPKFVEHGPWNLFPTRALNPAMRRLQPRPRQQATPGFAGAEPGVSICNESCAVDFSSFMVLGFCLIVGMIACGYAWDWLTDHADAERNRSQQTGAHGLAEGVSTEAD